MSASRRRFLQNTLAVGAAAMPWPVTAANNRASKRLETCDVIVVGAGLAGLNAALILSGEGLSVRLLEGSERVGGRVWTARGWHGEPDLGGVQIGPMYARLRDMARRLNIKLAPGAHVNAPYSYVLGEQLVPAKQWESSPLNRLTDNERRVPPQGLNSFYVEQKSPFTELDDWLKPAAAQFDLSLGPGCARKAHPTRRSG